MMEKRIDKNKLVPVISLVVMLLAFTDDSDLYGSRDPGRAFDRVSDQ